jgi:protocatechuate 3,4-dioxygenase beta subunit
MTGVGRFRLAGAALVLAGGRILAGTVEIEVVDDSGSPVREAVVRVASVSPADPGPRLRQAVATTDQRGLAVVGGLAAGPYEVSLARVPDPLLVVPQRAGSRSLPTVTLAGPDDSVSLRLELRRGVPVYFRMTVDRGELKPARLLLREIDLDQHSALTLEAERDLQHVLVPGRWEIYLDPPPGYLLVDFEVDGRPLEGSRAILEIEPGSPARYLTWYFAAPARVRGSVRFEGAPFAVWVEARLLEPGGWIEAARRRGGSDFQTVRGYPRDGAYAMALPDGRWVLEARGENLSSAEPPSVEIVLAAGDEREVDFLVRGEPSGRGAVLLVRVEDPAGRPVGRAPVEVWPLAGRRDEPLARARADPVARFTDLAAGDYLVAAGAPRFLEGTVELPGFEPDPEQPRGLTVRLEQGIRLHAVARDEAGRPVPEVALELERRDAGPETVIRDPELLETVLRPGAMSDVTGHIWVEGIHPGRYRLTARLSGPEASSRLVRFETAHQVFRDELELALERGEEPDTLGLVVLPAASFTGRLACARGEPLPGAATLVALSATVREGEQGRLAEGALEEAWLDRAALRIERQVLTGERRASFRAGPLEEQLYVLGVRPVGFDRWTWAMGGEKLSEAAAIPATLGQSVDLGPLPVDCGPAIRVVPEVPSGQALPDLRELERARGSVRIEGVVRDGEEERPVREARIDAYRGELVLRELPAGQAQLEVRISSGYFLPGPELVIPVRGLLEAGRTFRVAPRVVGIGGMIEVRSGPGPMSARLIAASGERRVERLSDGRALFQSVPAGVYVVELCAEPSCASVLQSWQSVAVAPLATTRLLPAPGADVTGSRR